jgi:hypothetical protein
MRLAVTIIAIPLAIVIFFHGFTIGVVEGIAGSRQPAGDASTSVAFAYVVGAA